MAKIEEALAKLQRAAAGNPSEQRRPIARVKTPVNYRSQGAHAYRGLHIEFDVASLRAQGFLAPDSEVRQLADEYGVIKRPLIACASPIRDPIVDCGNLLMVASAAAGEGKTFTCLNLALSIAREKDWSVLLIDGDCNKPLLSRLFGAQEQPGLMDLLRDNSLAINDLVMPTDVPGLSVIPAGKRDEHAAELLASGRMKALCAELSESDPQRIVVFDSSPLLLTTEAPVLASHVGQIVLVVKTNSTPQQAVLSALGKLDSSKAINLVLNQVEGGGGVLGYGDYSSYGEYGA